MKHLYFIRHGESVMNNQGLFSGRLDTPLNSTGIKQAQLAAGSIAKINFDCIVTSPMKRTLQTAEIIAKKINFPEDKIIINNFFIERNYGPFEGKPYIANLGDAEGVESIAELIKRAQQGIDFLNSLECQNILLVSHGAIGRAVRHCLSPSIPYSSDGFNNGQVIQLK